MAKCVRCGARAFRIDLVKGLCDECQIELSSQRAVSVKEQAEAEATERAAIASIIVTTETAHNLPVADRLDIVTAEVVLGMNFFKDVAAGFRDVFGGRSKVMQEGLRDARKLALQELRVEAHAIGAQAVVGVSLNYSEISDGGKVMLLLVAAGTAVTLSASNEALA